MLSHITSSASNNTAANPTRANPISDDALEKVGFVLTETSALSRIGSLLKSDPEFMQAMRLASSDEHTLNKAMTLSDSKLGSIKQSLLGKLILNNKALSVPAQKNKQLAVKHLSELAKIHFSIEALLPIAKQNADADSEVKKLQFSYALKLDKL